MVLDSSALYLGAAGLLRTGHIMSACAYDEAATSTRKVPLPRRQQLRFLARGLLTQPQAASDDYR